VVVFSAVSGNPPLDVAFVMDHNSYTSGDLGELWFKAATLR